MTTKVCNRDDCVPANTKAEYTTKCSDCQSIVHLPCIGISLKTSQINSPNIRIICDTCIAEQTEKCQTALDMSLNASKTAPTPSKKRMTIEAIANEVNKLRSVLEANCKNFDTKLDTVCNQNAILIEKSEKKSEPSTYNPSLKKTSTPKASTFANKLRANLNKRQREDENISPNLQTPKSKAPKVNLPKPKLDAPKPKIGTKMSTKGLTVVAKPTKIEKPRYTKAVWVSRLEPETTDTDIATYITENTLIKEKSKFDVHKLVKKDQDLSTLKFVSFKIAVNQDEFDVLMDPDVWPENVMVREFLQSATLGDFFPPLPNRNEKNQMSPTEQMNKEKSMEH